MVSLGFKLFNDIQRLLVSSRQPLERLILALDVRTLGPGDAGLLAGADRLARLLGQDLEGGQGEKMEEVVTSPESPKTYCASVAPRKLKCAAM